MLRSTLTPALAGLLTALIACSATPRAAPPSLPVPVHVDTAASPSLLTLPLSTGQFRYTLHQTATIQDLRPADSVITGTVVTTAILEVRISGDSSTHYTFSVTADSLQIVPQGPIPARGLPVLRNLGSVLEGSVTNGQLNIETTLPDSLCAYTQLITAASQLVLPQLPAQLEVPLKQVITDTTMLTSCRAGIPIQTRVTRRLQGLSTAQPTIMLQEVTDLTGAGMLRRDSVIVSGQIITRGTITLPTSHRLPSLIQTQSDGQITVRLGDSTTVFRQISRQEIRQYPTHHQN